MRDPFDLERFVTAQNEDEIYESAMDELRGGAKTGHWMWFVFPQVAGLGKSGMSRRYAIYSRQEARAYLEHPLLGSRLQESVKILLGLDGRSSMEIFGDIDSQKLCSCMTLFDSVADTDATFQEVLEKYFGGQTDPATLEILASMPKLSD